MSSQLDTFYNADRLHAICLTFDTDWAPDFVLKELIAELSSCNARATFFATNPSSALVESDSLEIGIHPNFMAGSSHGDSVEEVLTTLKQGFPNAVGMRSHGLWQSSNMLRSLNRHGILYDSNLLMYDLPYLQAFDTFYDVVRIPYVWSDASHLLARRRCNVDELQLTSPGIKVLDIHPMLWFLNSATTGAYNELKREHPALHSLTRSQAERFVNPEQGIRSMVRELLTSVANEGVFTYRLCDFHSQFCSHKQEFLASNPGETLPPYQFIAR